MPRLVIRPQSRGRSANPCGRARRTALLRQSAAAHHQDPLEIAGQAGAMQYPDQPAPGHVLPHAGADRAPGLGRRAPRWPHSGSTDRDASTAHARSRSVCRCASDSRDAAGADLVIEPDIDHGGAQPQRLEHLGHHFRHPHRRVGLAIGDLAEQDVVLQRGRGVVALGIEELDLVAQLLRQVVGGTPGALRGCAAASARRARRAGGAPRSA